MSAASSRLVVRCFAEEDEALVDEWPVVVPEDALRLRFPAFSPVEIRPVDASDVETLVGHPVGPFSEPSRTFSSPASSTDRPGPKALGEVFYERQ